MPGAPGWSWATVALHTEVNAAPGAQFPRGGRIDLGISAVSTPMIFGPAYTFAVPERAEPAGRVERLDHFQHFAGAAEAGIQTDHAQVLGECGNDSPEQRNAF